MHSSRRAAQPAGEVAPHTRTATRSTTRAAALTLAALVGLMAVTLPGAPAEAKKKTPTQTVVHELPFQCGTSWTGSTRSGHSPSKNAVDFNAPSDEGKPVLASARGVVTKADASSTKGYGRHVILDHGNGETTVYAHLKKVWVQVGNVLEPGAVLGDLGNTGNSSGAHLHYEQKIGKSVVRVRINGAAYKHGRTQSANCPDIPLAGDLIEGDGTEVSVFRRNASGAFVVRRADGAAVTMAIGKGFEEPLIGDWDGDGQMEPGVWSPRSKQFTLAGEAGFIKLKLGARGDRPVAGDWDGDGAWEVGMRRGATFRLRSASGAITTIPLGAKGDIPITGDWDGDGVTDLGTYSHRTSVFTLRTVVKGKVVLRTIAHGTIGDLPAVGDWNGDGITDLGTWTPSLSSFSQRELASGQLGRTARIVWGRVRL